MEQLRGALTTPIGTDTEAGTKADQNTNAKTPTAGAKLEDTQECHYDISHVLSSSIARTNIATLQQGLQKQTTYWSGIAWIAGSLSQRIEGLSLQDIDLKQICERLSTCLSLPDAGLADRAEAGQSQASISHGDEETMEAHRAVRSNSNHPSNPTSESTPRILLDDELGTYSQSNGNTPWNL